MADRSKPPPGYEVNRDWTWEASILLDKYQNYEEAIAACWAHRDATAREVIVECARATCFDCDRNACGGVVPHNTRICLAAPLWRMLEEMGRG